MAQNHRDAPHHPLTETLVERIARAVGKSTEERTTEQSGRPSPELSLIDPELARRESVEPSWARVVEPPTQPSESGVPEPHPRSVVSRELEIIDRREALASVLQGINEDLKNLLEAGATDLVEHRFEQSRSARLPRVFRAAMASPAAAHDVAVPAWQRYRRLVLLVVPLLLLFAAGLLLLPGARWLHRTHSQVAPPPAGPAAANASENNSPPDRAAGRLVSGSAHVFGWVAVANASSYRVRVFRAGHEVFAASRAQPRFVLPSRWRFAGRTQRLVPGEYHWVVQPVFGSSTAKRVGATIVTADFIATP